MGTWEYVPAISVSEHFGTPINKDNYFISREQPPSGLIVKTKIVLTELFALLDRLDIDIVADSEQGVSTIYLDNDDTWTVSYRTRERATIACNGYPAGMLILWHDEDEQ